MFEAVLRTVATELPAAVIMTIHDLSPAARFADQVAVLRRARRIPAARRRP